MVSQTIRLGDDSVLYSRRPRHCITTTFLIRPLLRGRASFPRSIYAHGQGRAVQYTVVVVVAEYSRCIGEPVRYLYSLFKQWPSCRSVVLVNLRQVVIQSSDIDTACSSRRARVPPLVWLSSKRVHQRLAWLLWLVAPHKTTTSIRRLISRFGSSLRRHFVHWRGFQKGLLPDKLLCGLGGPLC